MAAEFDPYHKWFGIPPQEQPPTHYRLLGIPAFTSDPDLIEHAAEKRIALLRSVPAGPQYKDAQRLLSLLAAAKHCLLVPEHKHKYDRWLSDCIAGSCPASMPPIFPTPAPIKTPSQFSLRSFLLVLTLGPPFLVCLAIVSTVLVSLVSSFSVESSPNNGYDITEYAQAQMTLRVTVTFAGLLSLVLAGLLLQHPAGSQPRQFRSLFCFLAVVAGLGLVCYGLIPRQDNFLDKYYYSPVPNAHGEYEYPKRTRPYSPITNAGKSDGARVKGRGSAAKVDYNEALNGFQWSVSLTGAAVLVGGVSLLFSKRFAVLGLIVCMIAMGIIIYPWRAFAPIP